MPFTNENIRLQRIIELLKSLAKGDFSKRIELSVAKDELDSIALLLNMLSEEWQERILHLSFIRPDSSYQYSTPLLLELDVSGVLVNSTYSSLRALDIPWGALGTLQIGDLLTSESKEQLIQGLKHIATASLETVSFGILFNHTSLLQHYQAHLQCFHKEKRYQLTLYHLRIQNTLPFMLDATEKRKLKQHSYEEIKIQKIHDYLHQHPMEEPLHLDYLCKQFGINQYSLKTRFKELYQTSLYQYYLNLRMNYAYLLIMKTHMPLNKISSMTGFKNYHNFFRNFMNVYGIKPNELRKK